MKDFEIVTRIGDSSFPDVHPTPSARPDTKVPGIDRPPHQGVDGLESKYRRCRQCGFINDVTKISTGSGYGNETVVTIQGSAALDPVVGAGCGFCGSSEF